MDSLGAKNPDDGIPPTDSDLRRRYLAERDVPCPGCGYNLRGLAAGACPECNQDLELGIKLASPRIGRLVAALTGLAAGAGASGAVLAIQVVVWTYWGGWGPIGLYLIPLFWLLPLGSSLALASRRPGRVWFRARTGLVQGAIIAASWTASAGFVLAYTWYLLAR